MGKFVCTLRVAMMIKSFLRVVVHVSTISFLSLSLSVCVCVCLSE